MAVGQRQQQADEEIAGRLKHGRRVRDDNDLLLHQEALPHGHEVPRLEAKQQLRIALVRRDEVIHTPVQPRRGPAPRGTMRIHLELHAGEGRRKLAHEVVQEVRDVVAAEARVTRRLHHNTQELLRELVHREDGHEREDVAADEHAVGVVAPGAHVRQTHTDHGHVRIVARRGQRLEEFRQALQRLLERLAHAGGAAENVRQLRVFAIGVGVGRGLDRAGNAAWRCCIGVVRCIFRQLDHGDALREARRARPQRRRGRRQEQRVVRRGGIVQVLHAIAEARLARARTSASPPRHGRFCGEESPAEPIGFTVGAAGYRGVAGRGGVGIGLAM
mmetsp:Transcript_11667/g.35401  ORF Transcript_11667/g.35401 Transcript_11667/m.35401 type:complete len:331 (+) Transcript_11667:2399-3391(+)